MLGDASDHPLGALRAAQERIAPAFWDREVAQPRDAVDVALEFVWVIGALEHYRGELEQLIDVVYGLDHRRGDRSRDELGICHRRWRNCYVGCRALRARCVAQQHGDATLCGRVHAVSGLDDPGALIVIDTADMPCEHINHGDLNIGGLMRQCLDREIDAVGD